MVRTGQTGCNARCGSVGNSISIASPRPYLATTDDDAHDAGLADQVVRGVLIERGGHQALLELVDLDQGLRRPVTSLMIAGGCRDAGECRWAAPADRYRTW